MLAVPSHANDDLFNWPDVNLYMFCWSTSRIVSAPGVTFVIYMARRPSANIAVLRVKSKVYKNFIRFS